jgi:hypothetical protein
VPGVDTIDALIAAAKTFDARPLGLQVEPDAEAAVRESLRRTGLVLLGEVHGVAQTPVLVEELIAWNGPGGRLVIAGKLHTQLEPLPAGGPMGAQLARQRPGLCSIDCVYGRGRLYNIGPRRHPDRLRGQHLDRPRLIRQQRLRRKLASALSASVRAT